MLLPVESILVGTWGGGEMPQEFVDFQLMLEMSWSWEQLQRTPPYVRQFCFDFLGLKKIAEQNIAETPRGA